jgi:transcriptional regulator with XRE-family HTH domain
VVEKRLPSVRGRQLAAYLRRLREAATLTGDEVAARMRWSPSKVSRIETAQTPVTSGDLQRLLDLYEVPGSLRDQLIELGNNAQQRGYWDAYGDTVRPEVATFMALEADADSARWYAPLVVPGLLQTEQYAREILGSTLLIAPPGRVERRVQVRLTSQRVLAREVPQKVDVILDEAVVRRPVGGPGVMRDQLRHLLKMSDRADITLRILPFAAGPHPGMTGGFTIFQFAKPIAAEVVYLEHMTSDLFVEAEADVYYYTLAFERLSSLALGIGESRAFIADAAGITVQQLDKGVDNGSGRAVSREMA